MSAWSRRAGCTSRPPRRSRAAEIVSARQVKVNYFLEGPRDFTGIILGSSRAFSLRAETAHGLGVRSFNFAGSNVNIEEAYCMLRLVWDTGRARPETIILGIDP